MYKTDVINIVNAHYGWSMDKHVPECKEEIRMKMKAMKQFVEELGIKADAYDELKELEEEWADEGLDYIDSLNNSGEEIDESVLRDLDNNFAYERAMLNEKVYRRLQRLKESGESE